MRDASEKKSIVKSIKLSPLQAETIQKKADEKNMSFSSYMVDCAEHGQQGLTPLIAVKVQEIINMAYEIVDSIDERDYKRKEEFRQKTDALCEICKPLSPQEKYDNLMQNVNGVIEGGVFVWASLK